MGNREKVPFFTIGHSTRSIDEFAGLLRTADVGLVVDIRTVPRSRTNPQFNADSLPGSLAPLGIGYELIPQLGGLRGKSGDVPSDVNGFWENRSFHNYADHALSDAFHEGLERLLALGRDRRCAMMCSEAVWWRCHRRIVTDYLLARGEKVFHLMAKDRVEPAKMTPGARVTAERSVTYPVS